MVNKNTLNSITNLSTICHFIFHTTVLQYRNRYSKSRIHREITFWLICSFIFCWIHADPDPKHWLQQTCGLQKKKNCCQLLSKAWISWESYLSRLLFIGIFEPTPGFAGSWSETIVPDLGFTKLLKTLSENILVFLIKRIPVLMIFLVKFITW